jgi:hypothetical protein
MTVSTKLVAGDTLSQDVAAPKDSEGTTDPASAGWTLTYRLVPRESTSSVVTVNAVADGEDYTLAVAASDTASWTPGFYSVSAYVTLDLETFTVEPAFSQVEILQNPRTAAAGHDGRTQAQKALDDARQALADAQARAANVGTSGSASGGLIEYMIGERRFKYATAAEAVASMIAAVDFWEKQLFYENRASAIARGMADPRQTYVRLWRA